LFQIRSGNFASNNRTRNYRSSQQAPLKTRKPFHSGKLDAGFVFTIADIGRETGATSHRLAQLDARSSEGASADKSKKASAAGFEGRCICLVSRDGKARPTTTG